jgi:8-oxo-dGTP pyrophosphatase MutT (NUDIX family)
MSLRPDLTATWLYRGKGAELRFLLLRRAAGRFLPGMWQCVTGSLEAEERIVEGALREVREETEFASSDLEALYDLDMVNAFHEPGHDAVLLEVTFAARLRPGREPTLSAEHDACRWTPLDEARALMVWPAYREALDRIADDLADPARARWWELSLSGEHRRLAG